MLKEFKENGGNSVYILKRNTPGISLHKVKFKYIIDRNAAIGITL